MSVARIALGLSVLPLLSGCVMPGPAGHLGAPRGVTVVERPESRPPAALPGTEAGSDGLTLTLSFGSPGSGAAVGIHARLEVDGEPHLPSDAEVWLRIVTPGGAVDRIPMERPAAAAGMFQTLYSVRAAGPHVVTAEGRAGTGADARTVSVTTVVDLREPARDDRPGWVTPAAVLAGLGTVIWMTVMMGGSVF